MNDKINTFSLASGQAGELGCIGNEVSQTLSRNNGGFSFVARIGNGQACEALNPDVEVCKTLSCMHDVQAMLCHSPEEGEKEIICYENHAQDSRVRTIEDGVAPTMGNSNANSLGISGNNPLIQIVCYENHANDSRITQMEEVAPLITSRCGTGGGNLPLIQTISFEPGMAKHDGGESRFAEEVCSTLRAEMGDNQTAVCSIALDGDKIAKKERQGGSGLGVNEEEVMYTCTAKDVHAVCVLNDMGGE